MYIYGFILLYFLSFSLQAGLEMVVWQPPSRLIFKNVPQPICFTSPADTIFQKIITAASPEEELYTSLCLYYASLSLARERGLAYDALDFPKKLREKCLSLETCKGLKPPLVNKLWEYNLWVCFYLVHAFHEWQRASIEEKDAVFKDILAQMHTLKLSGRLRCHFYNTLRAVFEVNNGTEELYTLLEVVLDIKTIPPWSWPIKRVASLFGYEI